jgi:hypothetical protein
MDCYPVDRRIWLRRTGTFVRYFSRRSSDVEFETVKALLTKGLQLETAGRGTLALYTSV